MMSVVSIAKIGMVTPVGLDAAQTFSSIQAGISKVSAVDVLDDHFEPICVGHLPDDVLLPLDKEIAERSNPTNRQARMLRLGSMALQEMADGIQGLDQIPLFLAVPRSTALVPMVLKKSFLRDLADQAQVKFNVNASKVFELGRAGMFWALEEAVALLVQGGKHPFVLVGGVDTYLDPLVLGALIRENRLLRSETGDGLRPGEGAAFLLVGPPQALKRKKMDPLAHLVGLGKGSEEGHRYSDKPYKGEGLAGAFKAMFGSMQGGPDPITKVYAGFNGEGFFAKEWGVALLRNRDRFAAEYQIEHPAEYIGDAGAALAPILCACAALDVKSGTGKERIAVFASSDEAERGVLCLSAPTP